jgi:hypothetical protein
MTPIFTKSHQLLILIFSFTYGRRIIVFTANGFGKHIIHIMKKIILKSFKNKQPASKDVPLHSSDNGVDVPKEVVIAYNAKLARRRSNPSTDASSDCDLIDNEINFLDDSSFHEIDIRLEFKNWRRQKADMEEKLEALAQQAKRQDELLLQMFNKLKSRTINAQLDKLEETLGHLELITAKNKQLEAENRQLKSMLRRRRSSLTTLSETTVDDEELETAL